VRQEFWQDRKISEIPKAEEKGRGSKECLKQSRRSGGPDPYVIKLKRGGVPPRSRSSVVGSGKTGGQRRNVAHEGGGDTLEKPGVLMWNGEKNSAVEVKKYSGRSNHFYNKGVKEGLAASVEPES